MRIAGLELEPLFLLRAPLDATAAVARHTVGVSPRVAEMAAVRMSAVGGIRAVASRAAWSRIVVRGRVCV